MHFAWRLLDQQYVAQIRRCKSKPTRKKTPSIPVSPKMIDFQVSRIGHPLSDVLYFLYTSTKPETRQKFMLVLLRYYFDTLTMDLRLLRISLDDYSWQDFLAYYKKRSLMWMFMGTIVLSAHPHSHSPVSQLSPATPACGYINRSASPLNGIDRISKVNKTLSHWPIVVVRYVTYKLFI